MTLKEIAEKYDKRIKALLLKQIDLLVKAGFLVGALMSEIETYHNIFRWWYTVHVKGSPSRSHVEDVDVVFRILDDRKGGMRFAVDVAKGDGEVLGGMAPDNYTRIVWIDPNDRLAIEQRFVAFEEANPRAMVDLFNTHLKFERARAKAKKKGKRP